MYLSEEDKQWLDGVWSRADAKLKRVCIKSRNKLPYTTYNGTHDNLANTRVNWWTNGFWGGMMWLMYLDAGYEEYKITALESEKLLDRAFENFKALHHDVGFLWHITSGANYRITGNTAAMNKTLYAAAMLASRYNIDGGYIRAWNGREQAGWSIVDCMMNIPLLYWASKEIGDSRFARIAEKHADMTLRDHIRQNGAVNHIVEHDTATGKAIRVHAGQGYSEGSCWTRGAAWAIYGMIISYIHTGKRDYLEASRKTADYFIEKCRNTDYLTPVDFDAPKEPVYYDSTAGVCAACGLIELAKCVASEASGKYLTAAVNILKATDRSFCDYSENEDAIVKMGSERYPHNDDERAGIHIPIIYGDFFFIEALFKLRGKDFLIW